MSEGFNEDLLALETRKTKALERIANSLDSLTIWFDEIDKEEWSNRIQYYLSEFHTKIVKDGEASEEPKTTKKNVTKKS